MDYEEKRPRKRRKNKALVIVLTILAVLAVAGTGIFLYVTPDQAAKTQYKEEAAVLAQEITDKRLTQLGEATASIIPVAAEDQAQEEDNTDTDGQQSEETPPVEVDIEALKASLLAVYDQILLDMQEDGMALIDSLITQAKADYKQLKADKKSNPAAVSKLATEYMSKGSALEEQMDGSFEAITSAMQDQMNSLGIDSESIISEYQNQYAQIKEQRQKTLIDKALNAIK